MKRFFTFLLSGVICINCTGIIPSIAYAAESEGTSLTEPQLDEKMMVPEENIEQAPDTAAQYQSGSMQTVYVSSTGQSDASGADESSPINDLQKAFSRVAPSGIIIVLDDLTVSSLNSPQKNMLFCLVMRENAGFRSMKLCIR